MLQGHLADNKAPPLLMLWYAYAQGFMVFLDWVGFLMSRGWSSYKPNDGIPWAFSRLALSWCVFEPVPLWSNSNAQLNIPFSQLPRYSVQGGLM